MDKLTICVPTFDRPAFLQQALESCFRQSFRPIEVAIGDDSPSDECRDAVFGLHPPDGIEIRYIRNEQTLGQSRNVNDLIARATGSHLMLLHDDDLLCDGGVRVLADELRRNPRARCVYGLQYVIDVDGTILPETTSRWNQRDKRVPPQAGVQSSPLRAALWHQVPNNGFLIESDAAKRSPLRDESVVGHAVDADFVIGVAKTAEPDSFVFVPEFVSKYRLTPDSIARSDAINCREDLFFAALLTDGELEAEAEARDEFLTRIAIGAALDAAKAGCRLEALRIMGSKYYSAPWLSRWTAYRLMAVATPGIADRVKRLLN